MGSKKKGHLKAIIRSFDNLIVRLYCTIRFRIINLRILEELEQYIPKEGMAIDLGCGFGLFSLYFCLESENRRLLSIDRNVDRIEMARSSSRKLGLDGRVTFLAMDVRAYGFDSTARAIVTLDLLHHLPVEEVPEILGHCHRILEPDGILLVKDVDAAPWWKVAFTWLLDKLMDIRTPVHYYHRKDMREMLGRFGFDVKVHQMLDILPYPHVLYVCRKLGRPAPISHPAAEAE